MHRVLFVCTGNACRSPMAEGFFNHMSEQRGLPAQASSAGLSPFGRSTVIETLRAAQEYGVDLSSHRPRPMTHSLAEDADLILTMTRWHEEIVRREFPAAEGKTFALLAFIGERGDVADPFDHPPAVHSRCAQRLWEAIDKVLECIYATAAVGGE